MVNIRAFKSSGVGTWSRQVTTALSVPRPSQWVITSLSGVVAKLIGVVNPLIVVPVLVAIMIFPWSLSPWSSKDIANVPSSVESLQTAKYLVSPAAPKSTSVPVVIVLPPLPEGTVAIKLLPENVPTW